MAKAKVAEAQDEVESAADELVEAALNGDSEALQGLIESGALDELDDEEFAEEPEVDPGPPLIILQEQGETEAKAEARYMLRPTLQGALTVRSFGKWFSGASDLNELTDALADQTEAVVGRDLSRGEAMLAAQAHTLDAIFNELARRASRAEYLSQFETYLKLGLRAQAQCRSTWEAVSAIQNPPTANFVKQANISHGHQQVNNVTRTGETEKSPNKLLENSDHEPDQWMDRGAQATAEGPNPQVETVGEVDGAEDAGGKS